MALAFDTIAATTIHNYRKTLTDNIFNDHPLLYWLKDKGRVRMLSGGDRIIEPIIHLVGDSPTVNSGGTPASTGSYGEYEDIDITPVDTATAAAYDWKTIVGTIAISGLEELKNTGEEALVNLLEAKIMQTEETLKSNLSTMLWATSLARSTDVNGLPLLVDSTGTVGDIAPGDFAGWSSVEQDKTAVAFADVDLRAIVRNAHNTASKGGKNGPDVVFSGQTLFENYESDLVPQLRYSSNKLADSGFRNLEVNGLPWMWDYDAPANTIIGVASKYLGIVGHKDRWFKQSKFSEGLSAADGGVGTTVDARYALITAALELTCRNRRRHFKVINIAES